MSDSLKKYIFQRLEDGDSPEDITSTLLAESSWTKEDIDETLKELQTPAYEIPQKPISVDMAQSTDAISLATVPEHKHTTSFYVLITLLIVGCIGLIVYSVYAFTSPAAPYSADSFIIGIASTVPAMETYRMTASYEINIEDRDDSVDAFTVTVAEDQTELIDALTRDDSRLDSIEMILDTLDDMEWENDTYPDDLPAVVAYTEGEFWPVSESDLLDPVTGMPYVYVKTDTGFMLLVQLETNEVLDELGSDVNFVIPEINYDTKQVTFTQDSDTFYFFDSEPEKTFQQELLASLETISPDFYFQGVVAYLKGPDTDYELSVDAEFDADDLIYQVAADARQINNRLYVQLRKLPDILTLFVPFEKNQWIQLTAEELVENVIDGAVLHQLQSISDSVTAETVVLAEKEQVFKVSGPVAEQKDNQNVFRYELAFDAAAFNRYREVVASTLEDSEYSQVLSSQDWNSPDVQQLLSYVEKNAEFTVWVTEDGFINELTWSYPVAPPESLTQLRGRQLRSTLNVQFGDVNTQLIVDTPEIYMTIDEYFEQSNPFGNFFF